MNQTNFQAIEKKWQQEWEKQKTFQVKESKKPKFYVLEMFPYPSGAGLHMGHALNYTIGDIFTRFKRMNGFNVLYPMGYDSLGLPAENAAIKAGTHPKKYTQDSIKNFINQQKALGLSYDWTRMLATSDENYYKWDQWIFLKMFEKGLAYKKKSPVNWCSKCNTVLANEQVHNGKCWRHEDTDVEIKHLTQWYFKITDYAEELNDFKELEQWPDVIKKLQKNWIGKSYGTEIDFEIENKNVNCVIVHGSNEDEKSSIEGGVENTRHWHPWLKQQLEEKGIPVSGELYPKDWNPDYNEWKKIFEKNEINERTVLIGHSAGCAFLVRWLSETKKKVKKVILVAPYLLRSKEYPLLNRLVDFDLDKMLKKYVDDLVVFYSDNDVYFILDSVKFLKKNINADFRELKGKGHFVYSSMGCREFPELLNEINNEKWPIFTTRPDTIYGVTFMVVSAQHPKLASLVKKEQKPEVEKFIKKLSSVSQEEIEQLEKQGVFTGSYAINPINKEKIPVYAGNFVLADYGCGMVMAVPAHDQRDFEFAKKYKIPIKLVIQNKEKSLTENLKQAYTEEGTLVNSGQFDNIPNKQAIEKITQELEKQKLGKATINFKLRDWLISRQRYWGTPIPIINCDECGAQPVPENQLPIKLPENIKFGKGNPLETAEDWINTKCPKCGKPAKRETDTMDTFVNSSWYYLRYTDSQNSKQIFNPKKVNYWCPVDFYIGGKEHACMHLIYIRFYTKFLRDLGLLNFNEPATKLFNQGMLHGEDGNKMSKSLGNVVDPLDTIKKYSADSLRLFLVSVSSPDSDMNWSDKGVQSSFKLINKITDYFNKIKLTKSSKRIQSKINKTIKQITSDIENLKYNLAVIKLRQLFESFENEISKKDAESFLKLLHPFCPHITEELWTKINNKPFLSLQSWPKPDESKIDLKLEQQEQALENTISDINNILNLIKEKENKEPKKIYLYTLPNETETYNEKQLSEKLNKPVIVFAVNDKSKHDPENKSKKAKPGKPGIYIE